MTTAGPPGSRTPLPPALLEAGYRSWASIRSVRSSSTGPWRTAARGLLRHSKAGLVLLDALETSPTAARRPSPAKQPKACISGVLRGSAAGERELAWQGARGGTAEWVHRKRASRASPKMSSAAKEAAAAATAGSAECESQICDCPERLSWGVLLPPRGACFASQLRKKRRSHLSPHYSYLSA